MNTGDDHKIRTLWLCGALHAFTHIYHVALMPLYLPIRRDLKLESIEQATVLLTLMMLAYFLPSYSMGVLADRFSRKKLLATGLAINGLVFVGPLYSGWRAESAGWRAPVLELGTLGIVMAGVFAWLAQEEPVRERSSE